MAKVVEHRPKRINYELWSHLAQLIEHYERASYGLREYLNTKVTEQKVKEDCERQLYECQKVLQHLYKEIKRFESAAIQPDGVGQNPLN